jgi:hypothetical protein
MNPEHEMNESLLNVEGGDKVWMIWSNSVESPNQVGLFWAADADTACQN